MIRWEQRETEGGAPGRGEHSPARRMYQGEFGRTSSLSGVGPEDSLTPLPGGISHSLTWSSSWLSWGRKLRDGG